MSVFKYIFKSVQYEYLFQYFKRPDLKLSKKEMELFVRYYQTIYGLKLCGHNSVSVLVDIGGYSSEPGIDKGGVL